MSVVNAVLDKVKGYSFYEYFICVCDLGIFDILFDGDEDIEAISKQLNITPSVIVRLLRPLESLGLIQCNNRKQYSITDEGRMFASQQKGNVLPKIHFHQYEGRQLWQQFGKIVRENMINEDDEHDRNKFIEYSCDEGKANLFYSMMNAVSSKIDITDIFNDFWGKEITIVDVGGGLGTLTISLLNKFKTFKGIVFDMPHLYSDCHHNIASYGLDDRCIFEAGDFFDAVPKGDVYILSRVLHDWSDSKCGIILNNVRMQMSPNSVLYVIEKTLPDIVSEETLDEFMMDLNVFCMCGGRERTVNEFQELLSKSHLVLSGISDVNGSKRIKCMTFLPEA